MQLSATSAARHRPNVPNRAPCALILDVRSV